MHEIRASARYFGTIEAIAELLGKLRIEAMFAGRVARAAWLGTEVDGSSVDVIALMTHQQKDQLAMMASNRGFRIDREEIEQSEELDLVPLNFLHLDGEVRVFVLLATNALYGRMVSAAVTATVGEREVRVPRAEDLALLMVMAEDEETVGALMAAPGFDRRAFEERLVSIGLGEKVVTG